MRVVARATPPRAEVRTVRNVLRSHVPIASAVPLAHELRVSVGERGAGPVDRARWTAARPCLRAVADGRHPTMRGIRRAAPPHLALRRTRDVARRQRTISRIVPLTRERGHRRREGVLLGHALMRAERTAGVVPIAVIDARSPDVRSIRSATPPHASVRPRDDARGHERTVFLCMPLARDLGCE